MRHLITMVMAAALLILTATGASAFDGQRRGFVLGGGLGFAPTAKWDSGITGFEENKPAFGLNILLGYGWDDYNLIVYEGNAAGYQSDFGNATITQMFQGAVWYHYFGPRGRSFFTAAGLGVYQFIFEFKSGNFSASGSNDPGGALLIGGGYEFAPHFQIGLYMSAGKTSEPGIDYDHTHINVLIDGIAF